MTDSAPQRLLLRWELPTGDGTPVLTETVRSASHVLVRDGMGVPTGGDEFNNDERSTR